MEYKGFTARVEFDQEAGVLFGEIEGLRDIITFEAEDVRGVEESFRASVDDYLAQCAAEGVEAEKPYSGKFMLRLDPRLHRDVAHAAAKSGRSLNAFASELLRDWLAQERSSRADISAEKVPSVEVNADKSAPFTLYGNIVSAPDARSTIIAEQAPSWRTLAKDTPGAFTPNTPGGSKTPGRAPLALAR